MVNKNFKWYNSDNMITKYAKGKLLTKAPVQKATEFSQEESLNLLYALLLSAKAEIQQGLAGTSAMYLAELMQDPQAAALIDQIVLDDPELLNTLDLINAMPGIYKKGGCTKKKKVKKGAKGCKPCKQLMKIGGRLVNVLTDCEGNIISRYQAGGWLIPKGEDGLEARQRALLDKKHNATWLSQLQGYTRAAAGPQYFVNADGKLLSRSAFQNTDGTYGWSDWSEVEGAVKNGNNWTVNNQAVSLVDNLNNTNPAYTDTYGVKQLYFDGTTWKDAESYFDKASNSVKWRVLGDATSFQADDAVAGANWDAGTISEADATAAGIDASKFATGDAPSVHGVTGTAGNSLYGTTATKPTVQLYIDHHGGWQNAMQAEDDVFKAKRRASRLLKRMNRRLARQAINTNGSADITINGETKTYSNMRDARRALRQDRRAYMTEAKQARIANQSKILGTLAPLRTTVDPSSITSSTNGNTNTSGINSRKNLMTNQTLKNGGWLTKFEGGGLTDMPLAPYLKWITAKNDPRLQPGDNEAAYNAIGYGRDDLYGDNLHVGTKGEKVMFLVDDPSTPEVVKEFLLNNTLPGIKYRKHNHKFIDYPVFYSGRAPFPQALQLPTDPIKKEKVIKEILK